MKKFITVAMMTIMAIAACGAAFAAEDKIGYIDPRVVLTSHPKYAAAQKQIDEFTKKQADAARAVTSKEKDQAKAADIVEKARQASGENERKVMNPITEDINKAIAQVAKAKGITVVMNKGLIFVGGVDLTNDVVKVLKSGK